MRLFRIIVGKRRSIIALYIVLFFTVFLIGQYLFLFSHPHDYGPTNVGNVFKTCKNVLNAGDYVLFLGIPPHSFKGHHWFHLGEHYLSRASLVNIPKSATSLRIVARDKKFADKMNAMGMFILFMSFIHIDAINSTYAEVFVASNSGHVQLLNQSSEQQDNTFAKFLSAGPLFVYDPSRPLDKRIYRTNISIGGDFNNLIQRTNAGTPSLQCYSGKFVRTLGTEGPVDRGSWFTPNSTLDANILRDKIQRYCRHQLSSVVINTDSESGMRQDITNRLQLKSKVVRELKMLSCAKLRTQRQADIVPTSEANADLNKLGRSIYTKTDLLSSVKCVDTTSITDPITTTTTVKMSQKIKTYKLVMYQRDVTRKIVNFANAEELLYILLNRMDGSSVQDSNSLVDSWIVRWEVSTIFHDESTPPCVLYDQVTVMLTMFTVIAIFTLIPQFYLILVYIYIAF